MNKQGVLDVKIKLVHPNAVLPAYAKVGDAGLDVTAVSCEYDEASDSWVYDTGIALELPDNYVCLCFPRSSSSLLDAILGNCVGVVDSGYRGTISFRFRNRLPKVAVKAISVLIDSVFRAFQHIKKPTIKQPYNVGDRIGQLIIIPYPTVRWNVVDKLSTSERGTGSYGHTGA